MNYYPINLDVRNKQCTVIGGGNVASRKIKTLLECGAIINVVSIDFNKKLQNLSNNKKINLSKKKYEETDIKDAFLVIGATNNNDLNTKISIDAKKNKTLCNIADCPQKSDFILPAFLQRGYLVLSISTSGASPAFAKKMREKFEIEFGKEYGTFLNLMMHIRKKLLAQKHSPEEHKPLFEKIIEHNIPKLIKKKKKLR